MAAAVFVAARVGAAETNEAIVLDSKDAVIDAAGGKAQYESKEDRRCVGYWESTNVVVRWTTTVPAKGAWRVAVEYAAQLPDPGPEVEVVAGNQRASGILRPTGDWGKFVLADLGPILFRKAGSIEVTVKTISLCRGHGINLRGVRLMREP